MENRDNLPGAYVTSMHYPEAKPDSLMELKEAAFDCLDNKKRENNNLYNERRLSDMKEFIAKNPRQLDICLRLLYAEDVRFSVVVKETAKHKIEYGIGVHADEQTVEALREKYRILIS